MRYFAIPLGKMKARHELLILIMGLTTALASLELRPLNMHKELVH